MSDTSVPIQPATAQAAQTPQQIKVFSAPDGTLIQAMTVVNEYGNPITPMSEATGQDLLQAIKAMHKTMIEQGGGGLLPSTRGLMQ